MLFCTSRRALRTHFAYVSHFWPDAQVEDELKSRGLDFGMPYWEWTVPNAAIPPLAADLTYTDPHTQKNEHNPFHDAAVAFMGERTTRQVGSRFSLLSY